MVAILEGLDVKAIASQHQLRKVAPDTCGRDTECHDVRRIIVWMGRIHQRRKFRYQETRIMVQAQMRDLIRTGWSSLPAWSQLTDITLRVDVQRAVDSVPNMAPSLIWDYVQGYSLYRLAERIDVPFQTLYSRLKRAWKHCRERLAPYGALRRRRALCDG